MMHVQIDLGRQDEQRRLHRLRRVTPPLRQAGHPGGDARQSMDQQSRIFAILHE